MKAPTRRVAMLVLLAVAFVVGVIALTQPARDMYWCDGYMAAWMLEAQDYQNTGCAYELPFWEAPPDADWTQVCLGLCPDSLLEPTHP